MATNITAATPLVWGRRVRFERRMRDWTQQELAEQVGVHFMTISRLERGVQRPRDEQLVRIARALELDPHEVFPLIDPDEHLDAADTASEQDAKHDTEQPAQAS